MIVVWATGDSQLMNDRVLPRFLYWVAHKKVKGSWHTAEVGLKTGGGGACTTLRAFLVLWSFGTCFVQYEYEDQTKVSNDLIISQKL